MLQTGPSAVAPAAGARQGPHPGIRTWAWTALAAVWITGAAHELGHILPALGFRVVSGGWARPPWASLVVSLGGPAATWAAIGVSCALARRQDRLGRAPWLRALIVGLGFAAGARFLLLAPAALTVFTGEPIGWRPDEFRIGRMVGVPMGVLVLGELVLCLACWAVLLRAVPRGSRLRAATGAALGVVAGLFLWLLVAEVLDVSMMK